MADYVITAGNVDPVEETGIVQLIAAVSITAGQPLYNNGGQADLADASAQASAACIGVALNNAAAGQPVSYAKAGKNVLYGAIFTAGALVVVSATAGGLAPYADLLPTEYVSIVGIATTTSNLLLILNNTGIQIG